MIKGVKFNSVYRSERRYRFQSGREKSVKSSFANPENKIFNGLFADVHRNRKTKTPDFQLKKEF